jgi:hypothetical protein
MPSASVTITVTVNAGDFINWRIAYLKSLSSVFIWAYPRGEFIAR